LSAADADECDRRPCLGDAALRRPRLGFEPFRLTLRPEIAAMSMSGSSVLVAVNALALKRLHLPRQAIDVAAHD
jgi:hypothetical protein